MENSGFQRGRRLRMFAGPNGSGKSTIFDRIKSQFSVGFYVNPDLIDRQLKEDEKVVLSSYGVQGLEDDRFNALVKSHPISRMAESKSVPVDLVAREGIVYQKGEYRESYDAMFLAEVLRTELLEAGKKISYETVMSHPSRVEFISDANAKGYKCYLYFVSTETPDINVARVELRVKQGGHGVDEKDVRSRYQRTMDLLVPAVEKCYRSFVFDNSGKSAKLICEVDNMRNLKFHSGHIPHWVNEYLLTRLPEDYQY
jgi:predicted ABC-type ATPase